VRGLLVRRRRDARAEGYHGCCSTAQPLAEQAAQGACRALRRDVGPRSRRTGTARRLTGSTAGCSPRPSTRCAGCRPWAAEAGLRVEQDRAGNVFARLIGLRDDAPIQ